MASDEPVDLIDLLQIPSDEGLVAERVYAIGDIHGCLDLLLAMEAEIRRDLDGFDHTRALICYLGDYVDRGSASSDVIEHLSIPAADGIRRIFLKGNHEDRMLNFLTDPGSHGPSWLTYGGRETFASYGIGIADDDAINAKDWYELRDRLFAAMPECHLRFLHELRLAFIWHDFVFVHAGVHPEMPLSAQSIHDLMWIREPFLSSEKSLGPTIVHGHSISDDPVFGPNRIGLDTGAYKTGILSCMVVTKKENVRLIKVRDIARRDG